ncbi:PAS domain S-box protein [Metabacillus halosaccharovorans]|uniref:PAS domain S-box protein n=1 Tax=Metabacillus halosaccharovorans TaxID=930124 RepID=UPI00203F72C8|nr:PAS domain S-box protein [Metabacillus halosaccharovorans]MCM3441747.1 PAS domain S-box protein [Metabacillus halosaccharovorans]
MERGLVRQEEVSQSLELYAVVSSNGRFQYISSNSLELLGYSSSELIGKYMKEFLHIEDLFLVESYFYNEHHLHPCSFRFFTKSGKYIWFEADLDFIRSSVKDVEQEIILKMRLLTKAATGLNDRKQNGLTKLNDKEFVSQDRILLEDLPTPVFISKKGKLCFVNQAFQDLLGAHSKEQLIGKHTFDFTDKGYHDVIKNREYRLYKGEKIGIIEETWHTLDGREINLEIMASLTRFKGDSAELVVMNDISSRRNFQKILQKSRERYQRLIDNSIDTIAVIHKDKWVFMNESGVKLFKAEDYPDMLGRNIYEYLHPSDHQTMRNSLKHILDGTSDVQLTKQSWLISKETTIYTEMVCIPTTYYGEKAVQVILRDISYRKKTEELMIRSEKLSIAGQLAAGIAHEIRNPLTSIKGFLQIMQPDISNHSQYFHIIFSELNRIEMILSELLMLAKPQETKFTKTDLVTLLNDVAILLETQGNMNNVSILQEHSFTELQINCDENQLKQVFINLFKNAIDAMPKGGKVKVLTEKINQSVKIIVKDEGEGIPPEFLERIGEPFLTTKEKGNGLGLMITYKIIENHSGNMYVESEVGKGSIFTIILPCR